MKRKESSHSRRMSKHSKRKESLSSSKSDMASESESYYDSFLPIKKEVPNYIIIEKKFYEKLIKYIENTNSFKEKLKEKLKKIEAKKPEYTQSVTNVISIISKVINKNENIINLNYNKDNNLTKTNDNTINLNNSNNNINNKKDNNINENKNLDNNINNKPKVNPSTSIMSLFMNSQKEKAKEKEEITKLKLLIEEMKKKHETEINNYKEIIKEFSIKIDTLQKELKNLKEINEKYKQKENYNKQKIQIVLSHPKILSKLISYLNTNEKLNLSKCNNYLFQNLYFRAVTENIYNKLKLREKILEKFENEDLSTKLEVKENEISNLFKYYIIDQKVSGKEMRSEIVKSLIFLENYVKIPLSNFKGPQLIQNSESKEEPKKEKFFSKFFSAIKSEIKEEIGFYNNDYLVKNNYINLSQNEFANLSDNDKHVLETFQTDKSLNIKFEYKNSDKIKDIINEFFICQLPQPTYQKFIQKICETFCELLYSSFLALNDIKNLQIIVFALYARYMRYKIKIEYQQTIIDDLNHFADSSREIKEMLTKTKNELEFKYTNSIMTISQLNNVIIEKEKEINNINSKAKEKEEKYDKFKNELIKEYEKIKQDFNFTKGQRDSLKGILNELKDFFVKVVNGELLN